MKISICTPNKFCKVKRFVTLKFNIWRSNCTKLIDIGVDWIQGVHIHTPGSVVSRYVPLYLGNKPSNNVNVFELFIYREHTKKVI